VAHLRARVDTAEEEVAHHILPPRAFELFAAMPVADRRHALDVVHRLLADGHDDADLLAAALMHDVAKGRRMRLSHRVGGVFLETVAPSLLRRLASTEPRSWRHGFHLYLHHGPISADLAVAAGCSARAGALIRGDTADADARLVGALKLADDAS
jgi:hypothetical protein